VCQCGRFMQYVEFSFVCPMAEISKNNKSMECMLSRQAAAIVAYSSAVYISNSSPDLRRRITGSSTTSTPGPAWRAPSRCLGKIFVPDHPNRKASSWAKSSPKPSISPLTNGRKRLIAAPRINPQTVGGEYRIKGELADEEGGEEISLFAS